VAAEAVAKVSTRAAVITDIHGNVPALEAALCRIGELSVDDVYCGGDLVGYGPPRTRSAARSRSGAYRRSTATTTSRSRAISTTAAAYPTPKDREIGQGSVAWTLVHTDERSKRFMRDLPFDLRFELAGKRVRLVNGSPRKVNEYLLEDWPASSFERIARPADCA
jgi:hypothetical protein